MRRGLSSQKKNQKSEIFCHRAHLILKYCPDLHGLSNRFIIALFLFDQPSDSCSAFVVSPYSVLRLFTGFAIAALKAWKLIVPNAMMIASNPAPRKTHQLMLMR